MNQITNEVSNAVRILRETVPLVHNITNYVTVNDCANALLAIGASPIMADDIAEAADISAISSALVLNIGTLNQRTIASMLAAGKKANELGIPVVFDPVGAGASKLRNDATREILKQVKITVLRGNISEVSFVAGLNVSTKGVDASEADGGNDAVAIAKAVAEQLGCTAAITGAVDVISDGKRVIKIHNGHPMLSKVTGTGCMTSALVGAYAGALRDGLTASVAGVVSMGIAGELAYEAAGQTGTGSFHIAVINALGRLDSELMEKRAKLDEA
ncbi:hydroxyethylthiazole kinase [Caproiciproducens faecalis]|uniref:Hydroxyethylthiazole kinase n=1 Tax=Caproiciproducens faecalis TaxID=2820301 RepID=A0ABS7DMW6_9FIRM|nr:hydroxyethylthiazole kinase [Caproiciproducens faecalis]MBW7572135.1 hydroxyethylthiazole kinase [Caproiciproducens faecalis]